VSFTFEKILAYYRVTASLIPFIKEVIALERLAVSNSEAYGKIAL
jgi:hypothetical protein